MKKIMVVLTTMLIIGGAFANTASATVLSRTNPVGFSRAWERAATGDSGRVTLTFGFNTRLINEDYAWSRHTTRTHSPSLTNSRGRHSGASRGARTTARIEVRHGGSGLNSVTYRAHW